MKTTAFILLLVYGWQISLDAQSVSVPDASVFFSGTTGNTPVSGGGTRMMWVPAKAAFRSGSVLFSEWDDSNIGVQSFVGGGLNNMASGTSAAVAGGEANFASGPKSFVGGGVLNKSFGSWTFVGGGEDNEAIGDQSFVGGGTGNTTNGSGSFIGGGALNQANGHGSFITGSINSTAGDISATIGLGLRTSSFAEVAVGMFNVLDTGDVNSYDGNDRIFVIGNGTAGTERSNALSVYKSGDVEVPGGAVYCTGTLGGTPVSGAGTRMMWIPAKAAFRAGAVTGDDWNDVNIGQHSFVAGGLNNIAGGNESFSGGGSNNDVWGAGSFAGGGHTNQVIGQNAFAGGGMQNLALDDFSSVIGGQQNLALAINAVVAGGTANDADGTNGFIGGGADHYSAGVNAGTVGGLQNLCSGAKTFAGGGHANGASGENASVIGGSSNTASGLNANITGGTQNTASGSHAVITGGQSNSATAYGAFVGGGYSNNATAQSAAIAGGSLNIASAANAFVGAGAYNQAKANSSVALGYGSYAFSFSEVVIGTNNTHYTPTSTTGFHAQDRLFVIGNGSTDALRSNAMVVYKNANVELSGRILNEADQTPTLLNDWENYGFGYANAHFYKDKEGRVHLQGLVTGGTSGLILVLPAGYRPADTQIFTAIATDVAVRIDVRDNGEVIIPGGFLNNFVSLSGISFRVE